MMKVLTAVTLTLLLSSTSALAFQERPVQEAGAQTTQAKTAPLSQFSDDDNDGAISQAYGPAAFSGTSVTSNGYPMPLPSQHRNR
ncbi:hypothetical protein EGM70_06775 [Enterobacteriaceae bacterium 89]|jgi:hypothetical protein|nr:hypothetical protein [Enterobacteriaceae bacterium 89]